MQIHPELRGQTYRALQLVPGGHLPLRLPKTALNCLKDQDQGRPLNYKTARRGVYEHAARIH
jgi:hypothetical protein